MEGLDIGRTGREQVAEDGEGLGKESGPLHCLLALEPISPSTPHAFPSSPHKKLCQKGHDPSKMTTFILLNFSSNSSDSNSTLHPTPHASTPHPQIRRE